MPLSPGARLGPYEILSALGAGGMGEVYRATDGNLKRSVAIKVLPASVAGDADRLARFQREAEVLAALNHPNIAGIYGLEKAPGLTALVMELVEGEDLSAHIARGPIPLAEALPIAKQIAEALEAAHEQGIIHRDLKPANVKVRADGTVKVLDFGLAKALVPGGASASADAMNSPTLTSPAMTEMGMILGTAGYMAPEQAKGKAVDRRADIWAFGVVLFEMLSGRSLYRGETVTETIAHVITQPPAWDRLPASTPAPIRRLLARCLEKDPRRRLQSAGDVRIEIEEFLSGGADTLAAVVPAGVAAVPMWRRALPWAIAGALLVALAFEAWPRPVTPAPTMRLDALIAPGQDLFVDPEADGAIAVLSPDGQTLVYLAVSDSGTVRRLYVRSLDRLNSSPIAGTETAVQPFFSPDGRSIAYLASGRKLMRTLITGGAPVLVTNTQDMRGGTWGPDNTIVYADGATEGLSRVPASGGTPVAITKLAPNERTHRWPSFLPDGKTVLFMCQMETGSYDDGTIEAVRLDTGERKLLVRGGTFPRYVPGYLIFSRENTLFAVRFTPETLEVHGEPQPILPGVMTTGAGTSGTGAAQVSFAANGTLAYLAGGGPVKPPVRLAVVDRTGKVTWEFPDQKLFRDPRLSPDGRQIAVRIEDSNRGQLHIVDLARGTLTKITFDGGLNGFPVWSPDGQQLAYASDRGDGKGIEVYMSRSDATGEVKAVTSGGTTRVPTSFSPDGRSLAIMDMQPQTSMDLAVVSLADRSLTSFLHSPAVEFGAQFSPDGKWIVYQSSDAGHPPNIFVRAYPDGSALRQVSSDPGFQPFWTKNGRELVYATFTAVMAVDVTPEGRALALGTPHKLFDAPMWGSENSTNFDASLDGSRFAVLLLGTQKAAAEPRTHVTLVFNFLEDIRRAFAGR
jgi:serine/threonine-protein kinase